MGTPKILKTILIGKREGSLVDAFRNRLEGSSGLFSRGPRVFSRLGI